MPKLINKNYIDKAHEWLHTKSKNNRNIELQMYYEDCGKIYYVDNKKVVMDYSKKELEIANWLKDTFNEKVILLPKVNYPEHIQTADFIFKGEKWDLKEIKHSKSNFRSIDNIIKDNKHQSQNFIIDVTGCKLSQEMLFKQIDRIFENHYRKWINKIILKKDNELLGIFIRK